MAKPQKDEIPEETRRIMERLVNTPPKPHKKDDKKQSEHTDSEEE